MSNEAPPAAPPAGGAPPAALPPQSGAKTLTKQQAAEQLKNPALGLLAAGALGVLSQILTLLLRFGLFALPAALSQMPGGGGGVFGGIGLAVGIVIAAVGFAVNLFVIYGALQMKSVKSYPLSVAAAAVAIIPFFSSCPCCFLGMGFGIWAIIILIKPEVKAAFK